MPQVLADATTTTGTSLVDFTTIDTSAVVPTIVAAIGVGIGICITVRVIKKGYSTLMGFIGRA